jgi:HEAT repeat protein
MATNAIDHIGVTALPFLLKWLQYDHPRPARMLVYYLDKTPSALAHKLAALIIDSRQSYQLSTGAYCAFSILGPRAMPAFDDLYRLTRQTNSRFTATWALYSLSRLGTNALPPLLMAATNVQSHVRLEALRTIPTMPNLGDTTEVAVRALTNCLTDETPAVQEAAALALENLAAAPQTSVPALLACLTSTNAILRGRSAQALAAFGPQASNAIPALNNALTDPNLTVRQSAAYALRQIDTGPFQSPFLH